MGVTIHIEELVLHGFDPRDRRAIGDALRIELAALVSSGRSAPWRGGSIDRLDAGSVNVESVRSDSTPRAIAAAIDRGLR